MKNKTKNITLFIRQVIAELKKVIWPTKKDIVTYSTAVIIFVLIMATYTGLLDNLFGYITLKIFGVEK